MNRRRFAILSMMAMIALLIVPGVIQAQAKRPSPTEPGAVILPCTIQTRMTTSNPPLWKLEAKATNITGSEIPLGTKIYWKDNKGGYGMFTLMNAPVPAGAQVNVLTLTNKGGAPLNSPTSVTAWFFKN